MSDFKEYLHTECGFDKPVSAWAGGAGDRSEFVRFHDDGGDLWAFPFHHADSVCLRGAMLIINFGQVQVGISGPKAEAFFDLFCKRQLNSVKPDGTEIVSVRIVR